jgi:hypothetical protein
VQGRDDLGTVTGPTEEKTEEDSFLQNGKSTAIQYLLGAKSHIMEETGLYRKNPVNAQLLLRV